MANQMSSADQQLSAEQQAEIARLKEEYAKYKAAGDDEGAKEAHKAAEDIRASAGYSGGSDGSGYVLLGGQAGQAQTSQNQTGINQNQTANSGYQTQNGAIGDSNLSADLQAEIARLKEEYARFAAAGDMDKAREAHAAAERIRNGAGYSGGSDGSQYTALPGGGASAADVQKWLDDYWYTNYSNGNGWKNGFSSQMNQRSMANYIRQQMEANSKAWFTADAAGKEYLHQQNLELAEILRQNSGGAESIYDPTTGQWYTANANLGYGVNVGQYMPRDLEDWYKGFAGMTDEQIEAYRNDTDRYRNFVDQNLIRNWIDESSGYTGVYSQFVNGPYAQLLGGSNPSIVNPTTYTDVQGDGFNEHDYEPLTDAAGNIVLREPALKNNNAMTDYTRQFASYVDENGVIQPGQLALTHPGVGSRTAGANPAGYREGQASPVETQEASSGDMQDYLSQLAALGGGSLGNVGGSIGSGLTGGTTGIGSSTGSSFFSDLSVPSGGGDLSDYINQMYDASLKSQLAQLEAAYQENLLELDRNQTETDAQYNEQKRQTQGDAERSAANWRELALAQGLNTGAIGQAALAQNNQLQSDLNTLGTAQAKALDDIRNQRTLLGKQYQLQILQAQADNDMERAQALYQEAVRMDEVLMQKEAQAMDMMQTLLGYAASGSGGSSSYSGSAGSGSGSSGGYSSSGGSSSGSGSSGGNYDGLWAAAMASGYPQSYISNNYKKYGFTSSSGLWAEYQNYAENLNIAQSFVDNMLKNATSSQFNGYTVISGTSKLTDEQKKLANEILDEYVKSGYLKYPNP